MSRHRREDARHGVTYHSRAHSQRARSDLVRLYVVAEIKENISVDLILVVVVVVVLADEKRVTFDYPPISTTYVTSETTTYAALLTRLLDKISQRDRHVGGVERERERERRGFCCVVISSDFFVFCFSERRPNATMVLKMIREHILCQHCMHNFHEQMEFFDM